MPVTGPHSRSSTKVRLPSIWTACLSQAHIQGQNCELIPQRACFQGPAQPTQLHVCSWPELSISAIGRLAAVQNENCPLHQSIVCKIFNNYKGRSLISNLSTSYVTSHDTPVQICWISMKREGIGMGNMHTVAVEHRSCSVEYTEPYAREHSPIWIRKRWLMILALCQRTKPNMN